MLLQIMYKKKSKEIHTILWRCFKRQGKHIYRLYFLYSFAIIDLQRRLPISSGSEGTTTNILNYYVNQQSLPIFNVKQII